MLPAGVSAGEDIELLAVGSVEPERLSRSYLERIVRLEGRRFFDAAHRGEDVSSEGLTVALAALEPDGRFRAELGADVRSGILLLRACRARLGEAAVFSLPLEEPFRLVAVAAGCLRVRFVPTVDATEEELRALAGLRVDLTDPDGDPPEKAVHTARLREDLTVEFPALEPGVEWSMRAHPQGFAPVSVAGLEVPAGVALERDVLLSRGARIRGRVLNEAGDAVEGAEVTAAVAVRGLVSATGEAATDAEGRFEVRGLPAGRARLTVGHPGFLEARKRLRLGEEEVLEGVEIVLGGGGVLAGRVVWPDGAPAAGAAVEAVASEDPFAMRIGSQNPPRTEADSGGRFRFAGLERGPFAVRAELRRGVEGKAAEIWRARAWDVAPGAEVELVLARALELVVRAADDRGEPIGMFAVEARELAAIERGHLQERMRVEGRDGGTVLRGLDSGKWEIEASATGHAPIAHRVVLPREGELALELSRAAAVSGVVFSPTGAPVPEASVHVAGEGPWELGDEDARTDEQGRFALREVGPGVVGLVARSGEHAPGEPLRLDLAPGEERSGVRLVLSAGGGIEGQVLGEDGEPEPGRVVLAWTSRLEARGQATTDARGGFAIEGLAPGTYEVTALPSSELMEEGDEIDLLAMLSGAAKETVEVRAGETARVVLGPPMQPVRLLGRVTRAGEPVAGAVVAVAAERDTSPLGAKLARTGDDGRFEFALDGPGLHVVIAGSGHRLLALVPRAASHEIQVELPEGILSGAVTTPDGEPVRGAWVALAPRDPGPVGGERVTAADSDGRFAFDDLAFGSYLLRSGSDDGAPGPRRHGVALREGLDVGADRPLAGLEIVLPPAGRIEGTVHFASGEPAPGAAVFLRDERGRLLEPVSPVRAGPGGTFVYGGVGPGRYTASARLHGAVAPESEPVQVAEGASARVDLALVDGAHLLVTVEDGGGRSVRAAIEVLDGAGRDHAGMAADNDYGELLAAAIPSGERRIGPLPPGDYRVRAVAADGREGTQVVTLTAKEERAVRLRLGH